MVKVDSPIAIGDVLDGKYEVVAKLGEGAMGVVFEGRHQLLNKRVAIKTLHPDIAQDVDVIGRFEQEARAASAIGHRNIVEVFDLVRRPNGAFFMVMEYLEGHDLAEMLVRAPCPTPERVCAIMGDVLSALSAAHRLGIVHRDLKPENIFLIRSETGECVKLLDFGISKVLEGPEDFGISESARSTRFGTILGTPLYMSPEQASGQTDIDQRADIWAAGCVLYEMLCGQTPFDGENYQQILTAILRDDYKPAKSVRSDIPHAVEQVIARALAKERSLRFPSAEAMRRELIAAMSGWTESAAPVGGPMNTAENPAIQETQLAQALDRIALAEIRPVDLVTADAAAEPIQQPTPPLDQPASPPVSAPVPDIDRFAPPPSEDEQQSLVLAPIQTAKQTPTTHGPRAGQTAERNPAVRNHGRHNPRPIYRKQRLQIGGIVKIILLILVLGVGGTAGYRYYSLGYLITPPVKHETTVYLQVHPDDANIKINGDPLTSRPFRAKIGVRYDMEFHLRGRLRAKRTLTPTLEKTPSISVVLPYAMSEVDTLSLQQKDVTNIPASPTTHQQIDDTLAKLNVYATCLNNLAPSIQTGKQNYLVSAPRARSIRRDRIPVVQPLPIDAVGQCRTHLTDIQDQTPQIREIDQFGPKYLESVDHLVSVLVRLSEYYEKQGYEKDKLQLGRQTHPILIQRYNDVVALHRKLGSIVTSFRMEVQKRELELIAAREGKTTHVYLRDLALASQNLVWSLRASTSKKARKKAIDLLLQRYTDATDYVQGRIAQPVSGAGSFLNAMSAVVKLAKSINKSKQSNALLEEARTRHNHSIQKFNAMILL